MINNDAVNQIVQGLEQGIVSPDEIEALNKAITAGYGGAGKLTDLTYGGVLQAESLESTLKSITFDMKNLKMWPAISVDKAYNLLGTVRILRLTWVRVVLHKKKIRLTSEMVRESYSSELEEKFLTK